MIKAVSHLSQIGFEKNPIKIDKNKVKVEQITQYQFKKGTTNHSLFILLHGWRKTANSLIFVAQSILEKEQFSQATIIIPELRFGYFSTSNPAIISRDIVLLIDDLTKNYSFKDIYFIGHSIGALIARKVYILACGEIKNEQTGVIEAPFEKRLLKDNKDGYTYQFSQSRKWVDQVDRIILLAGINRGWTNGPGSQFLRRLFSDIFVVVDTIITGLGVTLPFLIFKVRRNTNFVTNLRVQSITLSNKFLRIGKSEILTIQLLGTQDGFVSPQDNIDFVAGKNFKYIDVPNSSHTNIIELDKDEERKDKLSAALTYQLDNPHSYIYKEFLSLSDLEDILPQCQDDITDVIFVVHGIRDQGFWTKKIARKVKISGNLLNQKWATETKSYGYFGMIPFLTPVLRYIKVEWLMEQYTEKLALYPNARFHYIGHSNGTYLVAKALQEYPCCHFCNIVFAGSVVPTNYEWEQLINNNQVSKVLNFVATGDWVVGLFPNLFESLGCLRLDKNLGGAGHKGFQQFQIDPQKSKKNDEYIFSLLPSYEVNQNETIHQIKYIRGSHGAALKEKNWEIMASFVVNGTVDLEAIQNIIENPEKSNWVIHLLKSFFRLLFPSLEEKLFQPRRNPIVVCLSTFPINLMIWIGLIWVIFFLAKAILLLDFPPVAITIFFIAYIFIIWQILNRV